MMNIYYYYYGICRGTIDEYICLFISQMFFEHLLSAQTVQGIEDTVVDTADLVPAWPLASCSLLRKTRHGIAEEGPTT